MKWNRTRRQWSPPVLALAFLAALACGERREPEAMGVVLRFVEPPPQEPFRREAVVEDRPVFDWRLEPHGVVAAFLEPQPRRKIVLPDVEMDLAWEGDHPTLVVPVDLDAAAVDRIDVMVESLVPEINRTGDVALYWAGPGEDLAESRKLVVADGEAISNTRRRYRLHLAGEPRWRGRISALKVVWPLAQKLRIQILRLTGVDETIVPERLRELAAGGIKGRIGDQIRDALPALPGAPVERRRSLPAGAELRFAYGLQPGVRLPVRFVVSAAAGDGRLRPLFEETVGPQPEAAVWHQGSVDLSDYAGEETRIVLEARAEGELDLARGLPLWGTPEVLAPRLGGQGEVAEPQARSAGGNVVLISLDTLRADHLSAYGYHRETSPRLAELAADGLLFEDFVVTGGGTLPSHLSMLTSLYPVTHGVTPRNGRSLPPGRVTLAEAFRDAGFATAAFTDGGWMRGKFGFFQGFEAFDEGGGRLAAIRPKVEAWLERHRDRRFFLFVHTYDIHSEWERLPYDCPSPDRDRFAASFVEPRSGVPGFDGCRDGKCASTLLAWANSRIQQGELSAEEIFSRREIEYMEALYDGCIRYTDAQVGGLIDKLRQLGLYDRSLIVVTSDHGEEFAEHGRFMHTRTDYEELVKIPLIMKLPGSRFRGRRVAGRRVPHLAAMVDLMPTVLEVMALAPAAGVQGRSLVPAIVDGEPVRRAVHIHNVLRTPRWKLFLGNRLYDLRADPGETENVLGQTDEFDPRLERYLKQAIARDQRLFEEFESSGGHPDSVALTDEEIAELEALGYLNR